MTVWAEPVVYLQLCFGRCACSMGLAVGNKVTTHEGSKSDSCLAEQLNEAFYTFRYDDRKLEA